MLKPVLATLMVVLCAVLIQGMPTYNRGRCLCQGRIARRMNMDNVAEVKFHRPSSSCAKEELVVVFKSNGDMRCLDVNFRQGRRIKQAIMQKRK
ncbi:C-X-C motif chemokine 11 [Elgaria multicarinata webbii]|uniref:C-X-C motif chemokine 11 n=1 Tax=Elgaria multicarinata webbii TaxID=159646 RepID=UPI002FCCD5EE